MVSTGAIGPSVHPPDEAPAGLSLSSQAGAIVAHYEHSEVCATKLLGSFFFPISLPDRNLETSMRIHFHQGVVKWMRLAVAFNGWRCIATWVCDTSEWTQTEAARKCSVPETTQPED